MAALAATLMGMHGYDEFRSHIDSYHISIACPGAAIRSCRTFGVIGAAR